MNTTHLLTFMFVAALAVLITALSGCGGSDATPEAAPTKKQYIKQADAICERAASEQFIKWAHYGQKHPGAEEEDFVEPVLLPPIEKQLQEVQNLPRPSGDEGELSAYFAALEQGLHAGKKDPPSVVATHNDAFEQARKLGAKYGFADCHVLP